jgi:hypothetical protein
MWLVGFPSPSFQFRAIIYFFERPRRYLLSVFGLGCMACYVTLGLRSVHRSGCHTDDGMGGSTVAHTKIPQILFHGL